MEDPGSWRTNHSISQTTDGAEDQYDSPAHEVLFATIFLMVYGSAVVMLLVYTMRRNRNYKTIEKKESEMFFHYIKRAEKQADRDAVELTKLRLPHLFKEHELTPDDKFGVSFDIFDNKRLARTIRDDKSPQSDVEAPLLGHTSALSSLAWSPASSPSSLHSPTALETINEENPRDNVESGSHGNFSRNKQKQYDPQRQDFSKDFNFNNDTQQ